MTEQLSSATQEVVGAYCSISRSAPNRIRLAAALRAAADQMRYTDQLGITGFGGYTQAQDQILAIADELEAQ